MCPPLIPSPLTRGGFLQSEVCSCKKAVSRDCGTVAQKPVEPFRLRSNEVTSTICVPLFEFVLGR